MKTPIEIIDETVAYYSEDVSRRSIGKIGDRCVYKNFEGKKCAVGRCTNSEWLDDWYKNNVSEPTLATVLEHLEPEYQGHSRSFWSQLQYIHDPNRNWDEKGLSEHGVGNVNYLKRQYENLD